MQDEHGNEYGVVKGKRNFQPIQDEFSHIPEAWRRWDLRHPEGRKAKQKKWWGEDKEYKTAWAKGHRVKERKIVLDHYGHVCSCCGETIERFLTIDHIAGGGTKHAKEVCGGDLYRWLIKNKMPEGFQTLCWNCNCSKRWGEPCPHETMDYSDRYGIG